MNGQTQIKYKIRNSG